MADCFFGHWLVRDVRNGFFVSKSEPSQRNDSADVCGGGSAAFLLGSSRLQ